MIRTATRRGIAVVWGRGLSNSLTAQNLVHSRLVYRFSMNNFEGVLWKKDPEGFGKFDRDKKKSDQPDTKQDEPKSDPKIPEPEEASRQRDNPQPSEPINKQKEKKTLFQPKIEEKRKWHVPWYLLGASLLAIWWFRERHEVDTMYQEFDLYVRQNKVKSITIRATVKSGVKYFTAKVVLKDGQQKVIAVVEPDQFINNLDKAIEEYSKVAPALFDGIPIEVNYEQTDVFSERLQRVFGLSITILEIVFVLWLMRRFGITLRRIAATQNEDQAGKTSVKKFSVEKGIKTTFHDIAGCSNQKLEMSEFVDFLKNPQKYEAAGARLPKGALLGGPPGTGKTLMAKACAGESGVPFFYMSGSDFVEKYVGVGASRVRKLFEAARKEAPSIIFIDEIDAVGRERQGSGNQEGDSTLNQLLVEMDGFNSRDKVVVFAATNRPDILDKALKRPGRFDRSIEFTLPNKEERVEIFKVHLRKIVTEERLEVISEKLAPICSGFSGADIMNLVNEAAIVAGRSSKLAVELEDFEAAMERVVGGLKKVVKLDEEEKYQIAIHEAGKAVVSWYLKFTPALIKMSIIPRAKSNLGFSQYVEYEKKLQTEEELRDLICHKMGGRAAEEIFFNGDFTTSAQKDLRRCYEMAYRIVAEFGMSKPLYNIFLNVSRYGYKSYSEKTNTIADAEIQKIVDSEYAKCKELLLKNKDKVEKLAKLLVEKEMLDVLAIKEILGDRNHESDDISVTQALKDVEVMLQQRQDDKAKKLADEVAAAAAQPVPEATQEPVTKN